MGFILAIETSGDPCSLAVIDEQEHGVEHEFQHEMRLVELLPSRILSILSSASIDLSQLSQIAVSAGPGSYTGLRVGIAMANAMAYSLDLPVCGIPTLETLAHGPSQVATNILAVIKARPGMVYGQVFCGEDRKPVTNGALVPLSELADLLQTASGSVVVHGDGLSEELTAELSHRDVEIIEGRLAPPTATSVARLALRAGNPNQGYSAPVHPIYLSEPLIGTRKKKRV